MMTQRYSEALQRVRSLKAKIRNDEAWLAIIDPSKDHDGFIECLQDKIVDLKDQLSWELLELGEAEAMTKLPMSKPDLIKRYQSMIDINP